MTKMENGQFMEQRSVYPELLWAGTEHSMLVAIEAHERIMAAYGSSGYRQPEEEEVPYLFKLQGDIGVIDIKGSLVNRDSPYNRYYGVTSYADISRALVYAATKPEVKGILLDVDSGGGAVNGCADCGSLIHTIDAQMKSVWAFSGGTMASAAYWQGSSARKVFSANTALLGSIGVLVTHMEYTELFKKMGIGATVMRAGEYKALVNPFEKLSERAAKQMQAQLDAAYGVFIGYVAERRHVTVEAADQTMGQGREFFGVQAVAAGLSDGIETFDSVFNKFHSNLLDNERVTHSNSGQYQRGSHMSRPALTEAQMAAAQAGITMPSADTEAAVQAAAAEQAAADKSAASQEVTEQEKGKDNGVLAFVQTQLAASQASLLQAQVDLKVEKDRVAALQGAQAGLVEIVGKSLNTMRISMKLSAVDASKLSADDLLAQHKSTTESFVKTFPVGGVAAAATDTSPESKLGLVNDPLRKARLAATSI